TAHWLIFPPLTLLFLLTRLPHISTLFPYTTLFRSISIFHMDRDVVFDRFWFRFGFLGCGRTDEPLFRNTFSGIGSTNSRFRSCCNGLCIFSLGHQSVVSICSSWFNYCLSA